MSDAATSSKVKKRRTNFTKSQLDAMEKHYKISPYISYSDVQRLAQKLVLSEENVKVWFKNRRSKDKKGNKSLPLTKTTDEVYVPQNLSFQGDKDFALGYGYSVPGDGLQEGDQVPSAWNARNLPAQETIDAIRFCDEAGYYFADDAFNGNNVIFRDGQNQHFYQQPVPAWMSSNAPGQSATDFNRGRQFRQAVNYVDNAHHPSTNGPPLFVYNPHQGNYQIDDSQRAPSQLLQAPNIPQFMPQASSRYPARVPSRNSVQVPNTSQYGPTSQPEVAYFYNAPADRPQTAYVPCSTPMSYGVQNGYAV